MPKGCPTPLVDLCFSSREITELLAFALDSYFDCEVRIHEGAAEAIEALQKRSPSLLVFDATRDDTTLILEQARQLQFKVAIFHPKEVASPLEGINLVGVFSEPQLLPAITSTLKQQGVKVKNPALAESNPTFPYFRVGIPLLLRTNPLVADIFVRLSELKYVKLFHKGAPFGKEEVKKYHGSKKIEHFYVRQSDANALAAKMNEALEALLRQVPLPQEVSTPVSIATIDTLHSLVNQVGFTPEVQEMVKKNVDLVLQEMYSSTSLGSLIRNLDLDREKYIASHSHILAEVSCALSIALKWDSDITFKKLTMASLLHDMSLSNQKLARIKDMKELTDKRNEFTSGDVDDYRTHSRRASVLISGIKDVPADVDKIILQHHELPTGTGFPESISHFHIHPLASLFIVAHDLVDWVLDRPGETPNIEKFIEEHFEKFKVGNFRKVLKALYSLQS